MIREVAFVLFVLLVVVAIGAWARGGTLAAIGGAARRARPPSPNLVVDTLNLAHWLAGEALNPERIVAAIDRTAAALKARHPGRVMYVLKDRDSEFNDAAAHALYHEAARRNGVYVIVAEQYRDPPRGPAASRAHSARGRDDFLMAVLAAKWRCPVLTEDRLRDFAEFRATLQPFHTYEFAYWRALPHQESYRPDSRAYARLRKPFAVRYADYGIEPATQK